LFHVGSTPTIRGRNENRKRITDCWLLVLFCWCGFTAQVQAGETYKMGLSLAITGPTSDAGEPLFKGVEDYFKFVNDDKTPG
jgi:branched-chain amino acid transport system substrate-binding protein